MNKLTKIIAVILVLLAVSLAALAWWMGHQPPPSMPVESNAQIAPKAPSYSVVTAAKKLEKGKVITSDGVKLASLPITANGTYADMAAVVGKVPVVDIDADALVTEGQLVHGLALKLAEGERAVAIPVDEVVGVGNRIEAGDYVDVFFTLKKGGDIDLGQSRLLASRRRVLTYGSATVGEASQPAGNALTSNQAAPPSQARTAVLATPIDQVNQLLLAAQNGKLTLVLRHPGDAGVADAGLFPEPKNVLREKVGLSQADKEELRTRDNQAFAGVDFSSWAGNGTTTRPYVATGSSAGKSASRSSNTLEVIKGTQRENVSF